MNSWADAAAWVGDGLRREVAFFPSANDRLYASLYAAPEPRFGLVVCAAWGFDMSATMDLAHRLAHGAAIEGGAGLVLHPPGHGESGGELFDATVPRMAEGLADAATWARSRTGADVWALAGIRLGASVAALTASSADAASLLLLQPALDPPRYFRDLARVARLRATAGSGLIANGVPLPPWTDPGATEAGVSEAIAAYPGRAHALRFESPDEGPPHPGIATATLRGSWWKGRLRRGDAMAAPALAWLSQEATRWT